jgi:hypothetical protein
MKKKPLSVRNAISIAVSCITSDYDNETKSILGRTIRSTGNVVTVLTFNIPIDGSTQFRNQLSQRIKDGIE